MPTLSAGGVGIMSNLSNHKKPAIQHPIRAAGAKLPFLPPTCPT
jgi:hypothetical protein